MSGLSLRPLRFGLHIALAAAGFSTPVWAQLPIQPPPAASESPPVPPPEASPTPAPAAPAAPVPTAPAAAPAAQAPAPPLAPAALPPAPGAPPGTAPAPAKAELITRARVEPDDDEDDDEPTGELGPRRKWYGWQTLTVDGGALGLLLFAASIDRGGANDDNLTGTLATGAVLAYGLGPGIVHFVHHNTGRGFASFGLRLGMPIAGAIVGAAAASGCNRFLCEADGAGVGLLAGIAGAITIDAALLAFEDQRPTRSTLSSLSPLFVVAPGRALVGVGGEL